MELESLAPQKYLDLTLKEYAEGENYELLKQAKDQYFDLTGKIFEEDDDYESRMNSFNEWFLSDFKLPSGKTPLEDFVERNPEIEFEIQESLKNITHSLYEFEGTSIFGYDVLVDILQKKKIKLPKDSLKFGLLKGDLFIGRSISYINDQRLLNGVCVLPRDAAKIIKKQIKAIRKLKDPALEKEFLIKTQFFRTKRKRYAHVEAAKIFVY